jgi:hypothetical protein
MHEGLSPADVRKEVIIRRSDHLFQATTRRKFLASMGVAASIVLLPGVFTACSDGELTDPFTDPNGYRLDLSTDLGILNYAYALEQLEAAFYTAAVDGSPGFNALSADEKEVIQDVQKHEVIHREFLRRALGTAAIADIAFNASTVASLVATRDSLLRTAQLLEDTGVSAYNGAGKYFVDPKYLLIAAKIVSVEARHAAAIRDMRDTTGKLFAGDDVVNAASGLDVKAEPSTVYSAVASLSVLVSPVSIGTAPNGTATADAPAPTPV